MTRAQCKYVEENVYEEEPMSTIRPATNPFDKISDQDIYVVTVLSWQSPSQ